MCFRVEASRSWLESIDSAVATLDYCYDFYMIVKENMSDADRHRTTPNKDTKVKAKSL